MESGKGWRSKCRPTIHPAAGRPSSSALFAWKRLVRSVLPSLGDVASIDPLSLAGCRRSERRPGGNRHEHLTSKILSGVALLSLSESVAQVCTLLRNVVVVRALTQTDYGFVATFALIVAMIDSATNLKSESSSGAR